MTAPDYGITDAQIAALRAVALAATDLDTIAICEAALNGHAQARVECARMMCAPCPGLGCSISVRVGSERLLPGRGMLIAGRNRRAQVGLRAIRQA